MIPAPFHRPVLLGSFVPTSCLGSNIQDVPATSDSLVPNSLPDWQDRGQYMEKPALMPHDLPKCLKLTRNAGQAFRVLPVKSDSVAHLFRAGRSWKCSSSRDGAEEGRGTWMRGAYWGNA